jgi:hypothetical protein
MKTLRPVAYLVVGLGVGLLAGATLRSAQGDAPRMSYDQVVAQVGETKVTRGQLAEAAILTSGMNLLDGECRDRAYVEEAARVRGINPTQPEIAARIDEYRNLVKQFDQFTDILGTQGILKGIPEYVLQDEARMALLAEKTMGVTINEAEADEWYGNNLRKFYRPRMVRLVMVSSEDRARALTAQKRFKAGNDDPLVVAEELNTDLVLKGARGDLGWVTRGAALYPQVAAAVFDANAGKGLRIKECTDIIPFRDPATPNGPIQYRVLYAADVRESWTPTKADVMPAVRFLARMDKIREGQTKWVRAQMENTPWQRITNLRDPNAAPKRIN